MHVVPEAIVKWYRCLLLHSKTPIWNGKKIIRFCKECHDEEIANWKRENKKNNRKSSSSDANAL